MAKQATTPSQHSPASTQPEATKVPTKRPRRTAADRIAELEGRIAATRAREAAKAARARPEAQALLVAIKALGKACKVAAESNDAGMVRALDAALAPLNEHAQSRGLRIPKRPEAAA